MSITKLDSYSYELQKGFIRIKLDATNDPILVDILSELDLSNGHMYVEGRYFIFSGYEIIKIHGNVYLILVVTENN